jgi:hypothetical protein
VRAPSLVLCRPCAVPCVCPLTLRPRHHVRTPCDSLVVYPPGGFYRRHVDSLHGVGRGGRTRDGLRPSQIDPFSPHWRAGAAGRRERLRFAPVVRRIGHQPPTSQRSTLLTIRRAAHAFAAPSSATSAAAARGRRQTAVYSDATATARRAPSRPQESRQEGTSTCDQRAACSCALTAKRYGTRCCPRDASVRVWWGGSASEVSVTCEFCAESAPQERYRTALFSYGYHTTSKGGFWLCGTGRDDSSAPHLEHPRESPHTRSSVPLSLKNDARGHACTPRTHTAPAGNY